MNATDIDINSILDEGRYRMDQADFEALTDHYPPLEEWLRKCGPNMLGGLLDEMIGIFLVDHGFNPGSDQLKLARAVIRVIAATAQGYMPQDRNRRLAFATLGACTEIPVELHVELWDHILGLVDNFYASEIPELRQIIDDEDLDQEFMRFVRMELKL